MSNKLLLIFILGFVSSSANTEAMEQEITKALGHYKLESTSGTKSGKTLTFVHQGIGAEHMIDIDVTEEGDKASLYFRNAKFDDLKKSFKYSPELFTAQTPAYVELVYRMVRTHRGNAQINFTTLDDLFIEIGAIRPSYSTSVLPSSNGAFNFIVKSGESNVMRVAASIEHLKPSQEGAVEEDFQVNLDLAYSNQNKEENKNHSFLMFSKKDLSFLKDVLAADRVENVNDALEVAQRFFSSQSKPNYSCEAPFANKFGNLVMIIGHIEAKLLVEVSQKIAGSSDLAKFTIKVGKVANLATGQRDPNLMVPFPTYEETFNRCESGQIRTALAKWDLSEAFQAYDHIIMKIYKMLHKDTYEKEYPKATLENTKKEKSSGLSLFGVKLIGGSKGSDAVISLTTVYNGESIAHFEVKEKDKQASLTFTNLINNEKYNIDLPLAKITSKLVEDYLKTILIDNTAYTVTVLKKRAI